MRATLAAWLCLCSTVLAQDLTVVADTILSSGDFDTITVKQGATLRLSRDEPVTLKFRSLIAEPGSTLDLGTVDDPIRLPSELIIKETVFEGEQPLDTARDSVLMSMGDVFIHGLPKDRKVELDEPLAEGQTQITCDADGWEVGDKLVICDLRPCVTLRRFDPYFHNPLSSKYSPTDKTFLIEAKEGDTYTLSRPLPYAVEPVKCGDDVVMGPIIFNLSSSLTIRSESPNGFRGHVMLMGGGRTHLKWASFWNLGRTGAGEPFDPELGRYQLHWHHHRGEASTEGLALHDDRTDTKNTKWHLVVHDSHDDIHVGNVAHGGHGAGFVEEDGNEARNTFTDCWGVEINGTGSTLGNLQIGKNKAPPPAFRGREGAACWLSRFATVKGGGAVNCRHGLIKAGAMLAKFEKGPMDDIHTNPDGEVVYRAGPEPRRMFINVPQDYHYGLELRDYRAVCNDVTGIELWGGGTDILIDCRAGYNGKSQIRGTTRTEGRSEAEGCWVFHHPLVHDIEWTSDKLKSKYVRGFSGSAAYHKKWILRSCRVQDLNLAFTTCVVWMFKDCQVIDCDYIGALRNHANPDDRKEFQLSHFVEGWMELDISNPNGRTIDMSWLGSGTNWGVNYPGDMSTDPFPEWLIRDYPSSQPSPTVEITEARLDCNRLKVQAGCHTEGKPCMRAELWVDGQKVQVACLRPALSVTFDVPIATAQEVKVVASSVWGNEGEASATVGP